MKKIAFLFILLLVVESIFAQQLPVDSHLEIARGKTRGETATSIGKTFLNVPYIAKTLESTSEKLICRFDGLDCYTFVENVTALTLMKYKNQSGLTDFKATIQSLRYRNSNLTDYASRLHYFIDWARQAENNGILTDITHQLGGKEVAKSINFMSTHPTYYPALSNSNQLSKIKAIENHLNERPYYEISKSNFYSIEKMLKEGDIVVFTSTVAGLDVNHEGFVTIKNGVPHLLHASLDYKKVMVSPEPLGAYLNSIKKHAGIMVLRLNN